MSYHTLRVKPDNEEDPEETGLQVGESRLSGSVTVSRERTDLYVAECSCGWRKEYPTESHNGAYWDTFCHNRTRQKEGCPRK